MRTDERSARIASLIEDVQKAQDLYNKAQQEESAARSNLTSALNYLNQQQRALDKAIEEMKKEAPRESDWKEEERRKHAVRTSPFQSD